MSPGCHLKFRRLPAACQSTSFVSLGLKQSFPLCQQCQPVVPNCTSSTSFNGVSSSGGLLHKLLALPSCFPVVLVHQTSVNMCASHACC